MSSSLTKDLRMKAFRRIVHVWLIGISVQAGFAQELMKSEALFDKPQDTQVIIAEDTSKDTKKAIEASASLISNLTNPSKTLKPSVYLRGIYNKKNYLLKLETVGNLSPDDQSRAVVAQGLWMPENSIYSIGVAGTRRIFKGLGAYGCFGYSSKNLTGSDSTRTNNVDIGTINLRIGLEFVLSKNRFSAYTGFNWLNIVNGREIFDDYFGDNEKAFLHPEFGFKGRLDNGMYLDFQMILTNTNFRKVLGNKDRIIPILRLAGC